MLLAMSWQWHGIFPPTGRSARWGCIPPTQQRSRWRMLEFPWTTLSGRREGVSSSRWTSSKTSECELLFPKCLTLEPVRRYYKFEIFKYQINVILITFLCKRILVTRTLFYPEIYSTLIAPYFQLRCSRRYPRYGPSYSRDHWVL